MTGQLTEAYRCPCCGSYSWYLRKHGSCPFSYCPSNRKLQAVKEGDAGRAVVAPGPDQPARRGGSVNEQTRDQRIRVVQSKVQTFIKACGGTVPLHALRMYIETQERDDAIISRALVAPDAPFEMGRTRDGTPVMSLTNQPAEGEA